MADRQRAAIRQIAGFLCLGFSAFLIASFLSLAVIASAPLLLITSPLWAPLAAVASALLFGAASAAAASTWLFRYFTGRHPVGSDRVDFARNRIADTASHVKDYARGYGGYLHSRSRDAAPGA